MSTVERDDILATNEMAAGIADHWCKFASGREDRFLAYFVLENPVHEEVRNDFLTRIGASTELPQIEPETVLKVGRAVLTASSNFYDNGLPYDVMYSGSFIEPVQ